MINFIKNICSLEERRISTLMITYIAFSITGIYLLYTTGNIPTPLSYIIISMAGLIAGVNIAPQMMSMMNQGNSYGLYSNYENTLSLTNTTSQPTQNSDNLKNPV